MIKEKLKKINRYPHINISQKVLQKEDHKMSTEKEELRQFYIHGII
jgi:hypothetical protein